VSPSKSNLDFLEKHPLLFLSAMKPFHKGLHILGLSFSNLVKVYKNGNENTGKIRI